MYSLCRIEETVKAELRLVGYSWGKKPTVIHVWGHILGYPVLIMLITFNFGETLTYQNDPWVWRKGLGRTMFFFSSELVTCRLFCLVHLLRLNQGSIWRSDFLEILKTSL